MAKKQKPIKCKKCNNTFEIGSEEDKNTRGKEWTMVAPMPDKNGDVTITLMATWSCSKCGYTIRGSAGKTKGDFGGKPRKQQIDEMLESGVAFEIAGFATQLKVGEENLTKILNVMINKGSIKGKIKNGIYEP